MNKFPTPKAFLHEILVNLPLLILIIAIQTQIHTTWVKWAIVLPIGFAYGVIRYYVEKHFHNK